MKKLIGIALSLFLGVGSIYVVWFLYTRAFRPSLYAQMVSINGQSGKGLTLRLTNLGSKNIVLDTRNIGLSLLSLPEKPNVFMIYASVNHSVRDSFGKGTTLAPNQAFEFPEFRAAIVNAFSRRRIHGEPIVFASFESLHEEEAGYWRGNIKSFPVSLDLTDG